MSIRRFFTEDLNKQANENVLVEGWTEYYSNGPYTASMDDDAFSQFDGEMFPMDFTIERAGERIKEIRGLANARNYIDALVKQETQGITYPCDLGLDDYYEDSYGSVDIGLGDWHIADSRDDGDSSWFVYEHYGKKIALIGEASLNYGTCKIKAYIYLGYDREETLQHALERAGVDITTLDWGMFGETEARLELDEFEAEAYDKEEAIDAVEQYLVKIDNNLNNYFDLFNMHFKDKFGVDVKVTTL